MQACMFRPYRTRGQWGEPYGVVHKRGVQLLSLSYVVVHVRAHSPRYPLTVQCDRLNVL
jgi:hypothetical protein